MEWRPRTVTGRAACGMLVASALFVLVLCDVLLLDSIFPGFSGDCGGTPAPFAVVRGPDHVVFTARIVAVCCAAPVRAFPRFEASPLPRCKSRTGDCHGGIRESYSSRHTSLTVASHSSSMVTLIRARFPGSSPSWNPGFAAAPRFSVTLRLTSAFWAMGLRRAACASLVSWNGVSFRDKVTPYNLSPVKRLSSQGQPVPLRLFPVRRASTTSQVFRPDPTRSVPAPQNLMVGDTPIAATKISPLERWADARSIYLR